VVADASADSLSVLLGNGDGSFQVATIPAGVAVPEGVVLGDLNGDGDLDAVVGGASNANEVAVLLGDGKGGLHVAGSMSAGVLLYAWAIALGDLDGDGRLDLVTGGSAVDVQLGGGDGTFRALPTISLPGSVASVALADLNGDGRLDLATTMWWLAPDHSAVEVLLGKGDGSFGEPRSVWAWSTAAFLTALVAADLDGDGNVDLALPGPNGEVDVLPGRGDGSFGAAQRFEGPASSLAAGDLNGDGLPDLAAAGGNAPGRVAFLLSGASFQCR
jgi:hypothetical protein